MKRTCRRIDCHRRPCEEGDGQDRQTSHLGDDDRWSEQPGEVKSLLGIGIAQSNNLSPLSRLSARPAATKL